MLKIHTLELTRLLDMHFNPTKIDISIQQIKLHHDIKICILYIKFGLGHTTLAPNNKSTHYPSLNKHQYTKFKEEQSEEK